MAEDSENVLCVPADGADEYGDEDSLRAGDTGGSCKPGVAAE